MMRISTRSRFFRELNQGSLIGSLCGLFIDKIYRKTREEKKQVRHRSFSKTPSEEREKIEEKI